jgi:aminocarboxymuconate-semialdehyde decarboxylase
MVAVGRLVYSGHVMRYRNARIVVPMGAAGLPFLIGRLKQNQKVTPGVADPVEALAQLYFDSILHDPRVLQFVIGMLGADRLMMGSDMPFPIGDEEPMKIVAAAGLKPEQVASINGGLAAKLFRIG